MLRFTNRAFEHARKNEKRLVMYSKNKVVTVFGGTGFVGSQIVRELASKGWTIKVATRIPERAYFLRPCGVVGQVVPFACNYSDEKSIAEAIKGSDFVINCIGILFETRRAKFSHVHESVPKMIAKACKKADVSRFVQISTLGCNKGTSKYAKTKLDGEKALRKAFPKATIIRPSIIFGPDDEFFNMFAELARYTPILPLIGGGNTKFQPVYVGDVADAVMACLCLPDIDDKSPLGKTYELGGPEVVSFAEVYQRIFSHTGRKRFLVSLPFGIAKIQAFFLSMLPKPLLTCDQVESLKTDNVVSKNALTLEDLNIRPTGMALILPSYLGQYRPGGRFSDKKRA